jgi:hypothetical protein
MNIANVKVVTKLDIKVIQIYSLRLKAGLVTHIQKCSYESL